MLKPSVKQSHETKVQNSKARLSYRGQRMLALAKGKENIDDFGGEIKIITIRNVVRGTVITCNENNLSDYLENF